MQWQRLTTWLSLLLAWAVLSAWQWEEYGRERDLGRDDLRQQADSLTNAVVGGIRFHQRRGLYFEDQLQGLLEELVKSEHILAIAIVDDNGQRLLSAGKTGLLGATSLPVASDDSWEATGLRIVSPFRLAALPVGGARAEAPVAGGRAGGGRGGGLGPGQGAARGRGRGAGAGPAASPGQGPVAGGRGRGALRPEEADGPLSVGGQFACILIVDRARLDARCRSAAWLRGSVVAAGAAALLFLALAWRSTVRLAEARGHARLLEIEARHLRDLSQAAAGLAHETRNPLGLIRGWTQRLLQSGLESAGPRQQAAAVVEECDRVTARINQFLAFAKPCEPNLESVRVAAVVDELAVLLEPDLTARDLALVRAGVDPDEMILADREMLRQALFNLVQNAVQASPDGVTVEVSLGRGQNGGKRIEVADVGSGVPVGAVDSLFTPYFTTRSKGTGLGLAIVRRIAGAHGWQAGYTPRPDGGAIFWLDGLR